MVMFCSDTMEDWDQETLEKVVESKKNEYNQNRPTEIVCYFFLQNLCFANDVDGNLGCYTFTFRVLFG